MENRVDSSSPVNESSIYEGGVLAPIKAKDLLNNKPGITILMNNYNILLSQNSQKNGEAEDLKAQIEKLKVSRTPAITRIASVVLNIASTILIGIAINMFTEKPTSDYCYIIMSLGVALSVLGAIITLINPIWLSKYIH